MDNLSERHKPQNKTWQMGTTMQLRLWSKEENMVFYASFARNILVKEGTGLHLNRGILDMNSLQLVLRELELGPGNGTLIEELEETYPGGIWWEMVLYLVDLQGRLNNHTVYEVNYKKLKAVESLIMPLNSIFHRQVMPLYMIKCQKSTHPLTASIMRFCDFYSGTFEKIGTVELKWNSFIDCFMQTMVNIHGISMVTFLETCKENIEMASTPCCQSDKLVVEMERLAITSQK
ncbi:hypothetical protein BX661DRAFT_189412 [Kickxella alabastrina]|uniref:uncharacterized protein n=1 Tax=Kickxella alabastrina TaxID=61397 RepID=UPI002220DB5D|nr:uncharacterized protein BX661DRAFT_189412 [Kickxella alabastrina]KAI7820223.1 hypothetical protein BX661DRAFT_189412 [Kickxella alabastrina]